MIEKEIKDEFESYEIKTTSKMILDKMPKRKHLKAFNFKLLFPISIAFASILILCIIFIPNTKNNKYDKDKENYNSTISLNSKDVVSQVALEVLYAGNMNDNNSLKQRLLKQVTETEYKEIVDNVDNIYPLIDDIYNGMDKLIIDYTYGEYYIGSVKYTYKYNIDNYILYMRDDMFEFEEDDDELELEGKVALEIDENIYSGKLELEIEDEETEVKLEYSVGNEKITIEREMETEDEEIEYSYSYKVKGKNYEYEKKIKISDDNGVSKFKYEYENSYTDVEEELEIITNDNSFIIDYKYKSANKELEIDDLKLEIENDKRIYTYSTFIIEK